MAISFHERQLQDFDPDAMLHALDNAEIEHRLLAGGNLDVCLQRLKLAELTINAGDYGFPVCAQAAYRRETSSSDCIVISPVWRVRTIIRYRKIKSSCTLQARNSTSLRLAT